MPFISRDVIRRICVTRTGTNLAGQARLERTDKATCPAGGPKVTFSHSYGVDDSEEPFTLELSSCRDHVEIKIKCSIPFTRATADTFEYPSLGKLRQISAEGPVQVRALVCHELEVAVSDQLDDALLMEQACLSIMKIQNIPPQRWGAFAENNCRGQIAEEALAIARLAARPDGRLRHLNNVGVFFHTLDPAEVTDQQLTEGAHLPAAWVDKWFYQSIHGGLRAALFQPIFTSTMSEAHRTWGRVLFHGDWKLFDPSNCGHATELIRWRQSPENRGKVNRWKPSMTRELHNRTHLPIHSEFFTEKGYGAIVLVDDYVFLHIVVPDAVVELQRVDADAPGPVVGRVSGKNLQCQYNIPSEPAMPVQRVVSVPLVEETPPAEEKPPAEEGASCPLLVCTRGASTRGQTPG